MPFAGPDRRQKILVLLTMCFALFMSMLDNTVVNVALPTISGELKAGVSGLQWIVDGYILAFASLMLTGGIVGDRLGRKRAFLAGLGVFTVASLLCGLSQSTGQLIAFRALQGVGAALLQPGTLAILTNTFPPQERAQAIGMWAGVSGIALALGPTVGGFLVEHTGWQSVFFLNVPIGVLGMIVATIVVVESKEPHPRPFDPTGLALGTGGLLALTYGLIEANQRGWGDPVIVGLLGGGLLLLAGFVSWERRAPNAMMSMALFRIPAFSAGVGVGFAISFAMFGTFFFSSLYFQFIRGYSAMAAGVHMLPITGMIVFAAPTAGRLAQRYGSRWPLTFGLTTAGVGLFCFSRVGAHTAYPFLAISLALMGIGMGMSMTPMTAAVMNAVGPARAGLGSASTNTAREVGGVFGVALLGTILTTILRRSLASSLRALSLPASVQSTAIAAAGHGQIDRRLLSGPIGPAVVKAFMDGFHVALVIGSAVLLITAVIANRFIPEGAPADAHEGTVPIAH
jgi:EmrB/QacA subfamily drug resistance transporter